MDINIKCRYGKGVAEVRTFVGRQTQPELPNRPTGYSQSCQILRIMSLDPISSRCFALHLFALDEIIDQLSHHLQSIFSKLRSGAICSVV